MVAHCRSEMEHCPICKQKSHRAGSGNCLAFKHALTSAISTPRGTPSRRRKMYQPTTATSEEAKIITNEGGDDKVLTEPGLSDDKQQYENITN